MNNRELVSEYLDVISEEYQELKELAVGATDQELDKILELHFRQYASNIIVHLEFLQMIISRVDINSVTVNQGQIMSDNELEKHFRFRWDLLISDCVKIRVGTNRLIKYQQQKEDIIIKVYKLESEVPEALERFYRITVELENFTGPIASATGEEVKRIMRKQNHLQQERLTVRKFLDDKLFKKHKLEDL